MLNASFRSARQLSCWFSQALKCQLKVMKWCADVSLCLCCFNKKTSFSVALLCCRVSFSLQKTPFEILIVFIFFIFPFGLYLQSLDGKWQILSEGSLETGWSLLSSALASPKIRRRDLRLSWDLLSSPRLGMPQFYFPPGVWWLSYLICFSHFPNLWSWWLWLAGILLQVEIPAVGVF